MRLHLLALLILLGSSSMAVAQGGQFFIDPGATPATAPKVSADEVVARIMTFDQNSDGRVSIGELSERMRPLVDRGDKDGDRALDRSELIALSTAPVSQTGRGVFASGGYGFGEDTSFSSRQHIEGALEDLRLAADQTDRARPIVRTYLEQIERAAKADLLGAMEPLLSSRQLETFTASVNRPPREMVLRVRTPEGDQEIRVPAGGVDLVRQLDTMGLGASTREKARAAVDEYKLRLRLGKEADRAELRTQLTPVLGEADLNDFSAAIERRPVVATAQGILNHLAFSKAAQIEARMVILGDALAQASSNLGR